MQKHEQNGVEVFVTWFKDIERKRDIEDFIIFGNELVQVNESAWSKEGHDKIMLSVNRHLLSAYKHRWKTWRADGRTLKEAFRQLREASGKKDIYCEVQ